MSRESRAIARSLRRRLAVTENPAHNPRRVHLDTVTAGASAAAANVPMGYRREHAGGTLAVPAAVALARHIRYATPEATYHPAPAPDLVCPDAARLSVIADCQNMSERARAAIVGAARGRRV